MAARDPQQAQALNDAHLVRPSGIGSGGFLEVVVAKKKSSKWIIVEKFHGAESDPSELVAVTFDGTLEGAKALALEKQEEGEFHEPFIFRLTGSFEEKQPKFVYKSY